MKMSLKRFSVPSMLFLLSFLACDSAENDLRENQSEIEGQNKKGIPVEGLVVKSRDVHKNISLSGLLDPKHSVDILAEVSGKIMKIKNKPNLRYYRLRII
jgi:hypothetical protein